MISGSVVQFKYGEDGIDPTRSDEGQTVDVDYAAYDEFGDEHCFYVPKYPAYPQLLLYLRGYRMMTCYFSELTRDPQGLNG